MPGRTASADLNLINPTNEKDASYQGKHFWSDRLRKFLVAFGIFAIVVAIGTCYYLRVHSVQKNLRSDRVMKLTKKPQNDMREYQYAELPNGLAVLNVKDEKATNSGFSVAVEAGSMYDPKDLQGLAHFCEHMLFLGTEKYPETEGFREFATKHGGHHNAYTAEELTVYFLQVEHSGWQEGLDRFADFFRAPLFDQKFVGKEVHAVDSEMAKNKHSQNWRVRQLMRSLANPQSPVTNFNVGDANTLLKEPKAKGIDIVGALKEYYKENYCPPRMKVVTFGKDSLSTQLAAVKETFGQIPSGAGTCSAEPKNLGSPEPWPASRMGRWVETPSMLKKSELWVMFPLPDLRKEHAKHPLLYLKYIINYGGENSLKRILKDRAGLIDDADFSYDMHSAGTSVWFVADLTPKGRDHPDLILDHLFAFLSEVRRMGIDGALFKSLAEEVELEWNWSNQQGAAKTVEKFAAKMARLKQEDILSGDVLTPSPDPTRTYEMLLKLIPSNMNVVFVDGTPGAESKLMSTPGKEILPHYEAVYTNRLLKDIFPGAQDRWKNWLEDTNGALTQSGLDRQLKLLYFDELERAMVLAKPLQNIPHNINLDFAECPAGDSIAEALYGRFPEQTAQNMWYRQGSKFATPKVTLNFLLRAPKPTGDGVSAKQSLELRIWMRLLEEELSPKTVDVVGAGYEIGHSSHSLSFKLAGFTNNLPQLMDIMLSQFKNALSMSSTSSVFNRRYLRISQDLKEDFGDYNENIVVYAVRDRDKLISRGDHSRAEMLEALETLDPLSVAESMASRIVSQKLQHTYFAMGNISPEEAADFSQKFQKALPEFSMGLPDSEVEVIQPIVRPQRQVEVRKRNPKPGDSNHATVVTVMLGVPDVADRVLFGILSNILQSTAFEELRTKRQLGYIVSAGFPRISNTIAASCIVQGDAMMPDEVEPLIEWLFSVRIPAKLAEMTEKDFIQYRTSFMQLLKEPPKNFHDEHDYFWPMVSNGGQCLGLRDRMVAFVKDNLHSKQQLIQAWQRVLAPEPTSEHGMRSKIVVKYFADQVPAIPPVPTDDEYAESLKKQGVPVAHSELVKKEHSHAFIFDAADSKVRQKILADAEKITGPGKSYYPQEFLCGDSPTSENDQALLLLQENSIPHPVDIAPHSRY